MARLVLFLGLCRWVLVACAPLKKLGYYQQEDELIPRKEVPQDDLRVGFGARAVSLRTASPTSGTGNKIVVDGKGKLYTCGSYERLNANPQTFRRMVEFREVV
ncbi:MAG TPA: hypothetical protein VK658_02130 [Chryseolinea sp.]|nr:hypothetical protein [Chryseolinea sp.]